MKLIKSLVLLFLFSSLTCYGASLDQAKNFSKVTLSGPYNAAATSLVLLAGHGAKLPTTPPYNLVWWNATDYPDPSDDPSVEIVRATALVTDTLTVTRAQESTSASAHNIVGKTYKMIRSITAKEFNTDIPALDSAWTSASGGSLTLTGPTVARVMTAPDAPFTVARTDAANTFTGHQTIEGVTTTGAEGSGNLAFCTPVALTSVPTDMGGWNQFKVSGSDVTTTGQALVDITGLVTGTLSISSSYEFEAVLYCTTSAVGTGTEYGVNVTQAPTNISVLYTGPTTVAANVQVCQTIGTNANNIIATPAFLTTASEDGCIFIKGFFTTGAGASPVFSIRHLKVTSGTSTVKIGSVLRIRKL